jgi:SAM-dependent methyltransferase
VAEWKLFDGTPPETPEMLRSRGWMDLEHQPGFAERSQMVASMTAGACRTRVIESVTELGCGDGSMLAVLRGTLSPYVQMWGYDLNAADIAWGRERGLDLRQADILTDHLDYGDLIVAAEVAEHLADPHGWLRSLPGGLLILSSPAAETGDWHNPIHAWAWDLAGYRALVEGAGWRVGLHDMCPAGMNTFGGVTAPQQFQAILAVRP